MILKNILLKRALALTGIVYLASLLTAALWAMDMLDIPFDPRAGGMGDANTSLARGPAAIYWNPAGLGLTEKPELNFSYFNLIEGLNGQMIAYAHPIKGFEFNTALGLSFSLASSGDIQGYDNSGNQTQLNQCRAQAFSLSLGGELFPIFSVEELYGGINLKYVAETLSNYSEGSFAVDLGFLYRMTEIPPYHEMPFPLDLAICVNNIGQGMTFVNEGDELNRTFRMGLGARLVEEQEFSFLTEVDVSVPKRGDSDFGFGFETAMRNALDIRVGYKKVRGFGFGLGLHSGGFKFDYAWVPYPKLGSSHRVGLGIVFGEIRKGLKLSRSGSKKDKIELLYDEGLQYFSSGRYMEAIAKFSEILSRQPGHEKALMMMEEATERLKNQQ